MEAIEKLRDLDHGLSDSQRLKIADLIEEQRERLVQFANAFDAGYAAAERALAERAAPEGRQPVRWEAVDEEGNDNFATSIYEADYKGLLVARCNQNGHYPWQAAAIIRGLEQNKSLTRPAEQAVTDAGVEAAARHITKWLGFAWDGLHDGRVAEKGFPIFTHGQFGWGFQGRKVDMIDLARAALKAAMEAGRHG